MDGFHKIYVIERNSSEKTFVVREETDKNPNDITSRSHVAWRLDKKWKSRSKEREKQEWAIEKPKLEYARNLRGIYSIDASEEEYKDIIKKVRRNLERPKAAAMPRKRAFPKSMHTGNRCLKNKSQGVRFED